MKTLLLARVHLGAVAVLAALTTSACLLIAGLPRTMQSSFDLALEESLKSAAAQQIDFTVQTESRGTASDLTEVGQFTSRDQRFRSHMPDELKPVVLPPDTGTSHLSAKTTRTPVLRSGGKSYINIGWVSGSDRRVRWVEGGAPGAPASMPFEGRQIPLYEIGVVDEAVTKMGLELGTVKILGESNYAAVKVVGVFKAVDPADPWWTHNGDVLNVNVVQPPGKQEVERYITALTAPESLKVLSGRDRVLVYSWILGVDPAKVSSLSPAEIDAGVKQLGQGVALTSNPDSSYGLVTGLPDLLARFMTQLATAQTVMYLVLGGLLLVALGVIVLSVQLVVERMDRTLSLLRARGGALRQVTATGAGLVALAVAPAALAGYALSYLVPGPVVGVVHIGPALVLVTAVGFAAARIALDHRSPLNERRDDVATARPSAKRITLEVLVVGLALAGAYLLRTRGAATSVAAQGQDPFLLFVPIALTVATALITLRCYPYPLRLIVRLAARARPAVPFLGLTRAARARSFTVLPVLVLLPALAVSVFAAVMSGGISSTQEQAAWQRVGAPIRLEVDGEFTAEAIERVRATAGVEQVVEAQAGQVQVGLTPERAEIIAVDLAQWQRLLAGSPLSLPAQPAGDGVPALVSPELHGRGTIDIGWQSRMKVTEKGVIGSVPGFYTKGKFMVVPFDTNKRGGTRTIVNTLLIGGDADPDAVLAAAKTERALVSGQARALSEIQNDPLTATVQRILGIVTVALAGYALIAVIITLVVGAADRARAVSFLRTLGLSPRQAQGLTVLEVSPMILLTALAGLGLGLGLPAALGPGVDLSAYAGDLAVGDYELDLVTPALLAAGLAAVAVLGAYAHTAISRRRNLGSVLRVGD